MEYIVRKHHFLHSVDTTPSVNCSSHPIHLPDMSLYLGINVLVLQIYNNMSKRDNARQPSIWSQLIFNCHFVSEAHE
jgi:hypothetical protein